LGDLEAQMKTRMTVVASALVLVGMFVPAMWAQAPAGETATQFYTLYLAAFEKATKIEDVLPYMSTDMRKQIEATPAAERPKMFNMIKMMGGMNTGIKVTKEARTANGATLTAEAQGPDKKKVNGTIDVVREGTAWKLGKESWSSPAQ
jgi:hypothetical protein